MKGEARVKGKQDFAFQFSSRGLRGAQLAVMYAAMKSRVLAGCASVWPDVTRVAEALVLAAAQHGHWPDKLMIAAASPDSVRIEVYVSAAIAEGLRRGTSTELVTVRRLSERWGVECEAAHSVLWAQVPCSDER